MLSAIAVKLLRFFKGVMYILYVSIYYIGRVFLFTSAIYKKNVVFFHYCKHFLSFFSIDRGFARAFIKDVEKIRPTAIIGMLWYLFSVWC